MGDVNVVTAPASLRLPTCVHPTVPPNLIMIMMLMPLLKMMQGVKKGIVEVADLVVVTKADGDLAAPARHAAAEYGRALQVRERMSVPLWCDDDVMAGARM